MKVIFLDVDGVLNSQRNVIAQGGFPFPKGTPASEEPQHSEENLDPLAVGMVRRLCRVTGASLVLHSTWRMHVDPLEFGMRWGLPIIAGTSKHCEKVVSIAMWLLDHPEVKRYVIIDDDLLGSLQEHQVQTDCDEGFLYKDYLLALNRLGRMS